MYKNMKFCCQLFLIVLVFVSGCSSIPTYNMTESESTFQIASRKTKTSCLDNHGLIVFVTESKSPIYFELQGPLQEKDIASAYIDRDSCAAFFVFPGTYCFQKKSMFAIQAGEIIYFRCSINDTSRISIDEFTQLGRKFLTKECRGTEKMIPAHIFVPDLVKSSYRVGYYTGKTLGYVIASPFYIFYGTCYLLASGSKVAMQSGSPACMLGGALVYALTFWALPDDIASSITADHLNDPAFADSSGSPSISQTSPQKNVFDATSNNLSYHPNDYGLGIHSDRFGRPFQWEVMNDPNADTTHLKVKPNAYGFGIGADQYGRPVRAVTWP